MSTDVILFLGLALVAIGAALGMLFSRNAVYAALFLILNFATVAVFYLLLGAPFIAMAQVTVYAGAIMVLFLFVIMLLGAEELRKRGTLGWQQPMAFLLGFVLIAETAYLVFVRGDLVSQIVPALPDYATPKDIGLLLFDDYMLPFQVVAVLLLVAMIGAIVLTKDDRKIERKTSEEKP